MPQGRPHPDDPNPTSPSTADGADARRAFLEVAESSEYQRLRSSFRRFAFPMTIAGIVMYFLFVLLSIFAVDFMASPVPGLQGLNTGLLIGIALFAVVWIWTALYVRFANKSIDPLAESIRGELAEKGAV